jgi:oxalate decarboxylase/phosphoglucose isomerase-like protein (cupin superfamily)
LRRIEKPWGYETIWAEGPGFVGKVLHIVEGHRLSLQFHSKKDEAILVQTGTMELLLEDDEGRVSTRLLEPGDSARILPGRKHRFTALTTCDIVEVSTPELLDTVRLEDDYGRVPDAD